MPIDLEKLPAPAKKALSPDAPEPLRMMAAKGVIPGAKPADIVCVLVALVERSEEKFASVAQKTLSALPASMLTGALASELPEAALHAIALLSAKDPDLVAKLMRQPQIGEATVIALAEQANEAIGEIVATNETLLLRFPLAIEKLYMNKRVRMSTADRLVELAVRNKIELGIAAFKLAAQAIAGELIPEPTPEPNYDDLLFNETDQVAEVVAGALPADEDTFEVNDEGEENLKEAVLPLYAAIGQMTISQKIRRATLGTSAERLLLVRDTNRLVATAAASSPMLNENEAARIAASRNVIEDVLRIIARNPEFTRNYQIKLNLVTNPRTPLTFSSRIIPLLRDNDLRTISKSKNVPAAIQTAVKQHLVKKMAKPQR